MSYPTNDSPNPVPTNQDFSFLRVQPSDLRRGMLERARNGDFLANFHDRTPEERLKVSEWQNNMATLLEVMEERDLEAKRVQLLLKLVRDLLDQGPIHPPLRRLAREYTDALRDATSFECPIFEGPADLPVVRALWVSGPPPPLRFPPGPAHLLSLYDYGLRRANGRIPNPSAMSDDDVPDLEPLTDSSSDEAPFNPEMARLVARRDLLDYFATRVVELDAAVDNVPTATGPPANTAPAVNGVTSAVTNINGAASANNSATPSGSNNRGARTGRRSSRCPACEVTD